jgi:hypothetical protein
LAHDKERKMPEQRVSSLSSGYAARVVGELRVISA